RASNTVERKSRSSPPRAPSPATPPPTKKNRSLKSPRAPPPPKPPPADRSAGRDPPRLAANSPPIEVLRQQAHGTKLQIARKDRANRRSLGCNHNDLFVHGRITERDWAADPNAFALGGR